MKRITLFNNHICYLSRDLIKAFDEAKITDNFNHWLVAEFQKEFNLCPDSKSNIDLIDSELKKRFYKDMGEWVREKMRYELKFNTSEKDRQIYCYRITDYGEILFMVKDIYNGQYCRETIPTWSPRKIEHNLILFSSGSSALQFIQNHFSDCMQIKLDYL